MLSVRNDKLIQKCYSERAIQAIFISNSSGNSIKQKFINKERSNYWYKKPLVQMFLTHSIKYWNTDEIHLWPVIQQCVAIWNRCKDYLDTGFQIHPMQIDFDQSVKTWEQNWKKESSDLCGLYRTDSLDNFLLENEDEVDLFLKGILQNVKGHMRVLPLSSTTHHSSENNSQRVNAPRPDEVLLNIPTLDPPPADLLCPFPRCSSCI